ncbi:DUF4281 domain-containing protein [Streptomyces sp. WA6-1-16]|uniref:abscisic acid-deficient protein Aba4 family protein n=1 Tax=Streptomyces sp. WA6-1-16 TaxID=2879427 RepID=UPI001CE2E2AB|nr:abscisic acid-deficient protein Aba4 family protein [Streptomyces sp. WA6-1-16]UCA50084.1 DUF4281 domain-containing protein [Streptomyces sp. WA6-1-16]
MRQPPQRAEHRLAEDGPHHHALDQVLARHPPLYVVEVGAGERLGCIRVDVQQVDVAAVPGPVQRTQAPRRRFGGGAPRIGLPATPAGGAGALWAQVIAWDLLLGQWMFLQSRKLGLSPLLMGPLLVLTILLAPFGLLLFLAVRALRLRGREPVPG